MPSKLTKTASTILTVMSDVGTDAWIAQLREAKQAAKAQRVAYSADGHESCLPCNEEEKKTVPCVMCLWGGGL